MRNSLILVFIFGLYLSVVAAPDFRPLNGTNLATVQAQQAQSDAFRALTSGRTTPPATQYGAPTSGMHPKTISIVGFLADKYMDQEVDYWDSRKKKTKRGQIVGITHYKNKTYHLSVDNGDRVKVTFVELRQGVPSHRMQNQQRDLVVQQQLQLQQAISQSLSGLMSTSQGNDTYGLANAAALPETTQFQNLTQQAQPTLQDGLYLTDKNVNYLAKKTLKKTDGIPDYISAENRIVLKNGVILSQRLEKL